MVDNMQEILQMVLKSAKKTVGTRQVLRLAAQKAFDRVILADDADTYVMQKVLQTCEQAGVRVCRGISKAELGKLCGIQVGAACAGLIMNAQ